ncbi:unnamed protein product [Peniophora sp. CBMAI 1063]|nr:unnamed protein product [Peniophora sp. CBMAI 1063]
MTDRPSRTPSTESHLPSGDAITPPAQPSASDTSESYIPPVFPISVPRPHPRPMTTPASIPRDQEEQEHGQQSKATMRANIHYGEGGSRDPGPSFSQGSRYSLGHSLGLPGLENSPPAISPSARSTVDTSSTSHFPAASDAHSLHRLQLPRQVTQCIFEGQKQEVVPKFLLRFTQSWDSRLVRMHDAQAIGEKVRKLIRDDSTSNAHKQGARLDRLQSSGTWRGIQDVDKQTYVSRLLVSLTEARGLTFRAANKETQYFISFELHVPGSASSGPRNAPVVMASTSSRSAQLPQQDRHGIDELAVVAWEELLELSIDLPGALSSRSLTIRLHKKHRSMRRDIIVGESTYVYTGRLSQDDYDIPLRSQNDTVAYLRFQVMQDEVRKQDTVSPEVRHERKRPKKRRRGAKGTRLDRLPSNIDPNTTLEITHEPDSQFQTQDVDAPPEYDSLWDDPSINIEENKSKNLLPPPYEFLLPNILPFANIGPHARGISEYTSSTLDWALNRFTYYNELHTAIHDAHLEKVRDKLTLEWHDVRTQLLVIAAADAAVYGFSSGTTFAVDMAASKFLILSAITAAFGLILVQNLRMRYLNADAVTFARLARVKISAENEEHSYAFFAITSRLPLLALFTVSIPLEPVSTSIASCPSSS